MFNSLKRWVNLPLEIFVYTGSSGTGAKKFLLESVHVKCDAEGSVTLVKNSKGVEVVSTRKLYVDGSVLINPLDEVMFDNIRSEVITVTAYYTKGKADIKVVYI